MDRILIKIFKFFVGLLLVIFLIELSGNIYSYFFYPRSIISHKTLGYKGRAAKRIIRHYKDIKYSIDINSDGFRDDEFTAAKGYFRIMVLGDSLTFGAENIKEDIFCSLLEKKLKKDYPLRKIDVMNFGMSGFSTVQELLCLKEYAEKYQPDIIILMLDEANDFEENSSVVGKGRFTPYGQLAKGRLIVHGKPNLLQEVSCFLYDHSFIYYCFASTSAFSEKLIPMYKDSPQEYKLTLMESVLDEINSYAKAKEIPLLIFYIRYSDIDKGIGDTYSLGIKQYCLRQNITFEFIPVVITQCNPSGMKHWNKEGHFFAAGIIYKKLRESKLLDNLRNK